MTPAGVARGALIAAALLAGAVAARHRRHLPIALGLGALASISIAAAAIGAPSTTTGWKAVILLHGIAPATCAAAIWLTYGGPLAAALALVVGSGAAGVALAAAGATLPAETHGAVFLAIWGANLAASIVALAARPPTPTDLSDRCAAFLFGSMPCDMMGILFWSRAPRGYVVLQVADIGFLCAVFLLEAHFLWTCFRTSLQPLSWVGRRRAAPSGTSAGPSVAAPKKNGTASSGSWRASG